MDTQRLIIFCRSYNSSNVHSKIKELFNMVVLCVIAIEFCCLMNISDLLKCRNSCNITKTLCEMHYRSRYYTDTNYIIVFRLFILSVPTRRNVELFSSWCVRYQKIKRLKCTDYYFMWIYIYMRGLWDKFGYSRAHWSLLTLWVVALVTHWMRKYLMETFHLNATMHSVHDKIWNNYDVIYRSTTCMLFVLFRAWFGLYRWHLVQYRVLSGSQWHRTVSFFKRKQ